MEYSFIEKYVKLTRPEELTTVRDLIEAEYGANDALFRRLNIMSQNMDIDKAIFYGKEAWNVMSALFKRVMNEDNSPEVKLAQDMLTINLENSNIAPPLPIDNELEIIAS